MAVEEEQYLLPVLREGVEEQVEGMVHPLGIRHTQLLFMLDREGLAVMQEVQERPALRFQHLRGHSRTQQDKEAEQEEVLGHYSL